MTTSEMREPTFLVLAALADGRKHGYALIAEAAELSGDLMMQKEIDGVWYYTFAGRTKDVVDRGAEKINCEEVEMAVSTHLAVSGCAVVGMPDPILGERICAYIVPRDGAGLPGVKDLGQHLEQIGLAKFKWPERIETIDMLPLTKVGKLDKATLREAIQKKIHDETGYSPATTNAAPQSTARVSQPNVAAETGIGSAKV